MDKKKIRKKIICLISFILANIFVYVTLEGCGSSVTYSYTAPTYACGGLGSLIIYITDPIVDYFINITRDITIYVTVLKITCIILSLLITTVGYLIIRTKKIRILFHLSWIITIVLTFFLLIFFLKWYEVYVHPIGIILMTAYSFFVVFLSLPLIIYCIIKLLKPIDPRTKKLLICAIILYSINILVLFFSQFLS
jgi:hypothetical protein